MVYEKLIRSVFHSTFTILFFPLQLVIGNLLDVKYYTVLRYVCEELTERILTALHITPKLKVKNLNNIRDKIVVISSVDNDLGKDVSKVILENGGKVLIGSNHSLNMTGLFEQLIVNYPNNLVILPLDLSSIDSIIEFVSRLLEHVRYIDILINNGSVMSDDDNRQLTENGFEMHFGANHLGHFLLTLLLTETLKASGKARIIMVSSASHMYAKMDFDDINLDKNYNNHNAYFQSKLANVLFARELAKRLSAYNIHTYSVHPGYIKPELQWSNQFRLSTVFQFAFNAIVCISPSLVTCTTLYCALDHSVANESGCYYSNCHRVHTNSKIVNDKIALKLWDLSCEMLGLENDERGFLRVKDSEINEKMEIIEDRIKNNFF